MVLNGKLYAPTDLLPEKFPFTCRIEGWVGPTAGLDASGQKSNFFAPARIRITTRGLRSPSPCHYTDYASLLPRLRITAYL